MDSRSKHIIFDPLYGFIYINDVEWEIIHSPYYQRLRWIKQLGFSFYVFPGAEHSRFGHSIGVMNNAHAILKSCGLAVDDDTLFDNKKLTKDALYNKSLRLAALMHDLGTFPFSHTTENSYIKYGETTNQKNGKKLLDDHENLGSFIIKNTNFEGGITFILEKYGFDPQMISDLVKGVDPSILANQILHSEIDCDRMDYLLRDAHYTGLKYGSYDRDYLLHHFKVDRVGGHNVLTIGDNALHCVEDFLMSRFAWYSQVIRSSRGAKYDAVAEELTTYLLSKGKLYKYSELLDLAANDPKRFYRFNDNYFMTTINELYQSGDFDKNPKMKELAEILLFEKRVTHLRCPEFKQRLLEQNAKQKNDKIIKKANDKIEEIQSILEKKGGKQHWIVPDIPQKNIVFVKSKERIIKGHKKENVLLERDPVKMSDEFGNIKLLVDVESSIISRLENSFNFIPNVYCSGETLKLLEKEGIV